MPGSHHDPSCLSMTSGFQLPIEFAFPGKCGFDTFIDSGQNTAALHFLKEFATGRHQFCLLWGRYGSGKSHLLRAICQGNNNAVYLPLDKMPESDPQLLHELDGFSLVVLDDLQLISGKADWEEALFILFNQLHAVGARLCVALDSPLDQCNWQLPDLHSRLKLAVQFEMHELADIEKEQVLLREARSRGMPLKPEVVAYLLSRNNRNLHELMSVLDRLDTLSLSEKRRLTIPFIREKLHWQ